MANQRLPADATFEQHQHEVCNAFARAAVAMRNAAETAENFCNWFARVNNIKNITVPPIFNGQSNVFASPQQQISPLPAQPPSLQTGKKRKAPDEQDGKQKRQPKEKKVKDPNAPKRPPSAYLLYQNDIREDLRAQYPDMPYSQRMTESAKLWRELDPETKKPYIQATAAAKAKYEQEKAEYAGRNPTGSVNANGTKRKISVTGAPDVAENKTTTAEPTSTSDDSSDESSESGSSSGENEEDEEEDNDDEEDVAPEPPLKKAKPVKRLTPPRPKAEKKTAKSGEGKKKKKGVA